MEENFNVEEYHNILCNEKPCFIFKYAELYLLQRLSTVGLLCGTDWTPLYHNKFFYSRLDHSIGVALIIWNFTHNKKQTLAGLLHDVSTPSFSHVSDFRNGDALTQESTEDTNANMIIQDVSLGAMLNQDGIYSTEVSDYHKFPIADNEMPALSADRLEYMYPSGAALDGSWTLDEIEKNYKAIKVLTNEKQILELGFTSEEEALIYTKKFCSISLLLQHNENKLTLQLMADIISKAIKCGIICENDLFKMSEEQLLEVFTNAVDSEIDENFTKLFLTFRNMKEVLHTEEPVEDSFYVSLDVKKRYIDPLVLVDSRTGEAKRISEINKEASDCIKNFLSYKDTKYGCVKFEL
ncbi:MAG: hypothetical protein WCQ67_03040 [Treponema sp.]